MHVSITSTWGTSLDPFVFRDEPVGGDLFAWIYLFFWVFAPIFGGVFFAVRNLRAGRGDRRGATTIALFVFARDWLSHLVVQAHLPGRTRQHLDHHARPDPDRRLAGERGPGLVHVCRHRAVSAPPVAARPCVLGQADHRPIGTPSSAGTSRRIRFRCRCHGPDAGGGGVRAISRSTAYDPDVLLSLSGTGIVVSLVLNAAAQFILVLTWRS